MCSTWFKSGDMEGQGEFGCCWPGTVLYGMLHGVWHCHVDTVPKKSLMPKVKRKKVFSSLNSRENEIKVALWNKILYFIFFSPDFCYLLNKLALRKLVPLNESKQQYTTVDSHCAWSPLTVSAFWIMDPQNRAAKKNTSHGNEMLPQNTMHLIERQCYQQGSLCKDPAGNQTTWRLPDLHKEMQTEVVWISLLFIKSGQNHLARQSEKEKKR